MKSAIQYSFAIWSNSIKISAQSYTQKFYERLGFRAIGKEYLEDGIPHRAMIIDSVE